MTNFTTMTEYEVIKAAHLTILDRWDAEMRRKERLESEGKPAPLADYRLDKYEAQLRELEDALINIKYPE